MFYLFCFYLGNEEVPRIYSGSILLFLEYLGFLSLKGKTAEGQL